MEVGAIPGQATPSLTERTNFLILTSRGPQVTGDIRTFGWRSSDAPPAVGPYDVNQARIRGHRVECEIPCPGLGALQPVHEPVRQLGHGE